MHHGIPQELLDKIEARLDSSGYHKNQITPLIIKDTMLPITDRVRIIEQVLLSEISLDMEPVEFEIIYQLIGLTRKVLESGEYESLRFKHLRLYSLIVEWEYKAQYIVQITMVTDLKALYAELRTERRSGQEWNG